MITRNYETLYIIRPDVGEEQLEQTISQFRTFLEEQGATKVKVQNRGKRRFAYPIKKLREGYYILMTYTAAGTAIAPLERAMRLNENILRFMTIVLEEETDTEDAEDENPVLARA